MLQAQEGQESLGEGLGPHRLDDTSSMSTGKQAAQRPVFNINAVASSPVGAEPRQVQV